jgi:hypothetical protein
LAKTRKSIDEANALLAQVDAVIAGKHWLDRKTRQKFPGGGTLRSSPAGQDCGGNDRRCQAAARFS